MRRSVACIIFIILLFLRGVPARGDSLQVPADHATIQQALEAAAEGDTVVVDDGLYEGPGNRGLDFRGKAITLRSRNGAASTTIDCGRSARGLDFHSGEGPSSVLQGFTIRAGSSDDGGGIRCRGASPRITGCVLEGNSATGNGGAIACLEGSSPVVEDCTFAQNSAFFGGAAFCDGASPQFTGSIFTANSAYSGGGLHCRGGAKPAVTRCRFSSNAVHYGGGIYSDSSTATVDGSTFEGNKGTAGAGVFLLISSPVIRSSIFTGNSADGNAGGLCALQGSSPFLVNCLFTGNYAAAGGGISAETALDSPEIVNCTVADNGALLQGGGVNCHQNASPRLLNTVLWANEPEGVCGSTSFCLFQDDPRFVRPGTFDFDRKRQVLVGGEETEMPDFVVDPGDYRLLTDSPGLDSGSPQGGPDVDLAGLHRPCGGRIDIGAFESCGDSRKEFVRGDADADGRRDLTDAIRVLGLLFLGDAPLPCADSADADDSGRLDITDAVAILGYLFQGGDLRPPSSACGIDLTPSGLTCGSFPRCP